MECPRERHTAQEAHEQRRVAQWGQQATIVCHDQDREDGGMYLVLALLIDIQQWPNEQHRGAGRADEGCGDRSDGQDHRVVLGRRFDITGQEEPA
ncbi:hypothetical protein SDC9_165767 [bioreactor metagenome]|uniref:Uncharacterized protein n=1 Tax=bioreactor metagenome TaxID=1076179 RepID=A0A645FVD9_9ZZZZ